MLAAAPIRAYIPVSDVSRARKFYEEKVGLVPKKEFAAVSQNYELSGGA